VAGGGGDLGFDMRAMAYAWKSIIPFGRLDFGPPTGSTMYIVSCIIAENYILAKESLIKKKSAMTTAGMHNKKKNAARNA
jgi:hypothetical protein